MQACTCACTAVGSDEPAEGTTSHRVPARAQRSVSRCWDMAESSFRAWLRACKHSRRNMSPQNLKNLRLEDSLTYLPGSCHQGTTGAPAADAAPAGGRRHTAGADGAAATEIVGCAYRVTSLLSCSPGHTTDYTEQIRDFNNNNISKIIETLSHTKMHKHPHRHRHTCMGVCICLNLYRYTYIYTCVYIYMLHMYVCMHACMYVCTCTMCV